MSSGYSEYTASSGYSASTGISGSTGYTATTGYSDAESSYGESSYGQSEYYDDDYADEGDGGLGALGIGLMLLALVGLVVGVIYFVPRIRADSNAAVARGDEADGVIWPPRNQPTPNPVEEDPADPPITPPVTPTPDPEDPAPTPVPAPPGTDPPNNRPPNGGEPPAPPANEEEADAGARLRECVGANVASGGGRYIFVAEPDEVWTFDMSKIGRDNQWQVVSHVFARNATDGTRDTIRGITPDKEEGAMYYLVDFTDRTGDAGQFTAMFKVGFRPSNEQAETNPQGTVNGTTGGNTTDAEPEGDADPNPDTSGTPDGYRTPFNLGTSFRPTAEVQMEPASTMIFIREKDSNEIKAWSKDTSEAPTTCRTIPGLLDFTVGKAQDGQDTLYVLTGASGGNTTNTITMYAYNPGLGPCEDALLAATGTYNIPSDTGNVKEIFAVYTDDVAGVHFATDIGIFRMQFSFTLNATPVRRSIAQSVTDFVGLTTVPAPLIRAPVTANPSSVVFTSVIPHYVTDAHSFSMDDKGTERMWVAHGTATLGNLVSPPQPQPLPYLIGAKFVVNLDREDTLNLTGIERDRIVSAKLFFPTGATLEGIVSRGGGIYRMYLVNLDVPPEAMGALGAAAVAGLASGGSFYEKNRRSKRRRSTRSKKSTGKAGGASGVAAGAAAAAGVAAGAAATEVTNKRSSKVSRGSRGSKASKASKASNGQPTGILASALSTGSRHSTSSKSSKGSKGSKGRKSSKSSSGGKKRRSKSSRGSRGSGGAKHH